MSTVATAILLACHCATGSVCMNTAQGPQCAEIPATAPLTLDLPFAPEVDVVCTHSSGEGSHSWGNAFYALDLAHAYDEPPAVIRAAADGEAFVFGGEDGNPCPEPAGTPARAAASDCGMGWGNHVRVVHEGGYFTFYVHLDHALVKNGQRVRRGDPIGVEGWTGMAGHRHLHWSVQRFDGKHVEWDGQSVPFKFPALVEGKRATVDTATFQCAHANIGVVPRAQQPHLRSIWPTSPSISKAAPDSAVN